MLENEGVDLILMDVQMPEMDGFEATAAIRNREERTGIHLPIVAMTAHALKGDEERCLAGGMDGYLPKPIRSERLFEIVERFISATRRQELQPSVRDGIQNPETRIYLKSERQMD